MFKELYLTRQGHVCTCVRLHAYLVIFQRNDFGLSKCRFGIKYRCILLRLLKIDLPSLPQNCTSGVHQIISPLDGTKKQIKKPQKLQVARLRHR